MNYSFTKYNNHCIFTDIGQHNWDSNTWTPLIVDKTLLSGICHKPTDIMLKKCRKVENNEIIKLENLWKKDPRKTYDDIFEHNHEIVK